MRLKISRGYIFTLFILIAVALSVPVHAANNIGRDLASPFTTPAKKALIAGTVVTGYLVLFRKQIVLQTQKEAVADQPLKGAAHYGDLGGQLIPNAAYALGMWIAGEAGNKNATHHAKVMALATTYSVGVTTALKWTVREERPNGKNKQSFPSGHSTSAFAFAAVVGAENGPLWGLPAYALAGLVGFSRITDNKHYLHDVIAGMTIGMSYGLGIHYVYKQNDSPTNIAFLPIIEDDLRGGALIYRF